MTLEQNELDKLVSKGKLIGHDEIPANNDKLVVQFVEIMRRTEKIFSAKEMTKLTGEKNAKFYSDKMWNLVKRGTLVNLARGYYKYNFKVEKK